MPRAVSSDDVGDDLVSDDCHSASVAAHETGGLHEAIGARLPLAASEANHLEGRESDLSKGSHDPLFLSPFVCEDGVGEDYKAQDHARIDPALQSPHILLAEMTSSVPECLVPVDDQVEDTPPTQVLNADVPQGLHVNKRSGQILLLVHRSALVAFGVLG